MPVSSVSVVIPCYNCATTISLTLQAILDQSYKGFCEIIAVDDGSTDDTAAIIQSFEHVQYVYQDNTGPAQARKLGANKALGDILVFTDSDCVPQSDWIDSLVSGFNEDDIGAVAGSYAIANPHSWLALGIHQEIKYRHEVLMGDFIRVFGGYNVAIKRSLFFEVGGFDSRYRRASGEDNDLSYKIIAQGKRIRFQKSALVAHYHPVSVQRYLLEQYRHGYWRAQLFVDHAGMRRGDDYTFWKDLAEVPLALGCMLLVYLSLFFNQLVVCAFSVSVAFLIFEIFFGFVFCHQFLQGLRYGLVMTLRACARSLGFLVGSLKFICCKRLT